jgi:hypothetical protein
VKKDGLEDWRFEYEGGSQKPVCHTSSLMASSKNEHFSSTRSSESHIESSARTKVIRFSSGSLKLFSREKHCNFPLIPFQFIICPDSAINNTLNLTRLTERVGSFIFCRCAILISTVTWTMRIEVFCGFSQFLWANAKVAPSKLSHDLFVSCPLQFIIHK